MTHKVYDNKDLLVSIPGTAMNFKATCPIFALKSSVSEVFSTTVNLLSLGDI